MYLDNEIMEIIASAQFTPVSIIDGFTNIVPGINISNKLYDTYIPKFAGVASSALTLRQTSPTLEDVSANNFIRNDIDQSINGTLIINNNLGIQIGNSSPTFSLAKGSLLGNSSDATLMNSVEGGRFVFQAMKNQTYTTLLILDASTSTVQVGYNKQVDLSVNGQVTVNKTLRIASNNNTALSVAGGMAVKGIVSTGTLTVNSNTNLVGQVVVGSTIPFNTASIVPAANLYYDIGTPSRQFGTLYVNRINGNQFTGIAETANNLTNYRYFSVTGHTTSTIYGFNGTQNISVSTRLTSQAILQQVLRDNSVIGTDDRGNLVNIDRRDRILFSSGTSANAVLKQISKQDFTADMYDGRSINGQIVGNQATFNDILPPGTIILWPSAVLPSTISWVFCDGTTYLKDGPAYARLYSIIGDYYNDGTNTIGVNYKVPNIPGPTTGTYYIIKL
jgi:hypothetical protein